MTAQARLPAGLLPLLLVGESSMQCTPCGVFLFGPFRLDVANAQLWRDDEPVLLPPRPFALLAHLVANTGALMTRDMLLDAVWGHRHVSDAALKVAITAVRAALGDDAKAPRWIQTQARRGYRFIGAVARFAEAEQAAAAIRSDEAPAPEISPSVIVGRAMETERLRHWIDPSKTAPVRVALVHGEAGMGKSTLLASLVAAAEARGLVVAQGDCTRPAADGEPYMAVLDALSTACRGPDAAVWSAALRRVAPTWLAQLPWLSDDQERTRLALELSHSVPERMVREFGALLDRVAASKPVLVVLEDLHWSDLATIGLVEYLARRKADAAWRLACSFRPTESGEATGAVLAMLKRLRLHERCLDLGLEAFQDFDVDAYLARRVHGASPRGRLEFARALRAHTDGLPLFVAQAVRMLQRRGELSGDDGDPWARGKEALRRLQLPLTIRDLVEQRGASLPSHLQQVLEAASVIGLSFTDGLLATVLQRQASDVRDDCDALVREHDWLRSAGLAPANAGAIENRYVFRHAWYQRVMYARCAPASALRLHLAVADELAAAAAQRPAAAANAAEIASHLERALAIAAQSDIALPEVQAKACVARIDAGRSAEGMHALADALHHYEAARLLRPPMEERIRVQTRIAALRLAQGNGAKAVELSTATLAAARTLADEGALREVLVSHAEICRRSDRPHEAIACADELIATGASVDWAARCHALIAKADALRDLGELDASDDMLAAALALVPPDDAGTMARVLESQVLNGFQRGSFAQALPLARQGRLLYARAGDERGVAFLTSRVGTLSMLTGDVVIAEAELLDAWHRAEVMHDVSGQRSALLNLVKICSDRGDVTQAKAYLDAGWALSPDFESPVTECAFLHGSFYCSYVAGDLGKALHWADRVLAAGQTLSSLYWRVGSLVIVFDLFVHLGDFTRARALVDVGMLETNLATNAHQGIRFAIRRAWLVLAGGAPADALALLKDIRTQQSAIQPEDLAVLDRVDAQARLQLGDASGALERLANYRSAPTMECWALMLVIRLQACERIGHVTERDRTIAEAQQALSTGCVPAIERLLLLDALLSLQRALGRQAEARATAGALHALGDQLVSSLSMDPPHQSQFIERFAWAAEASVSRGSGYRGSHWPSG